MKRLKKILKWTGIVLAGLVAILLIANALFVWTTDTRLERQLAEIRAAGDPMSLAELARPPIPPEKNAATYLRRAEADLAAIEKETMCLHLTISEDREKAKAVLAAYPGVIPLLKQAAACPDYDAQLDYTLSHGEFLSKELDVVQKPRSAARVLHLRAMLLLEEGNRDEAVQTAVVILRLGHLLDRNPAVLSYMMAIAVRGSAFEPANRALQAGPVSNEVRRDLDAELAAQDRMDGFAWALKSERAVSLEFFQTGLLCSPPFPDRNVWFPGRNFWLIARGFWNLQESACLDLYPPLIALARGGTPYRQVEQSAESAKWVLARLLFPALNATTGSVVRTRAMIRCLRVLNAIQTHVPPEGDESPKLSELGLPPEATTDPYNGEPLHVKKTPQGWLVYSVGKNLKDDGGKLDDESTDVGVGPPPTEVKPAEE
jgi:hypothetical protein